MRNVFWKTLVAVFGCATIFFFIVAWISGFSDEQGYYGYLAIGCLVGTIALFPLSVREDRLGYWGALKKYFF